jgi:hypothetical protein
MFGKHESKTTVVNYRNYKGRKPKHSAKITLGTHKPSPVASILKFIRADKKI